MRNGQRKKAKDMIVGHEAKYIRVVTVCGLPLKLSVPALAGDVNLVGILLSDVGHCGCFVTGLCGCLFTVHH